jgi:hypothetical protein
MTWADLLKDEEKNKKNQQAEFFLEKARQIPPNNSTYYHLSLVHLSLAEYFSRFGPSKQNANNIKRNCEKALEFAKKVERFPRYLSGFLLDLGEIVLRASPRVALFFYEQVLALLHEEEYYFLYLRMAQCHLMLAKTEDFEEHINNALDNYVKSANLQNTSDGYKSVRSTIKEEIKLQLDPWNDSLLKKSIDIMEGCSRKTTVINPRDLTGLADYAEDLIEQGSFVAYQESKKALDCFYLAQQTLSRANNLLLDERPDGENNSRIANLKLVCSGWISKLEEFKTVDSPGFHLLNLEKILDLDQLTCKILGQFEKAEMVLLEYFDLVYPFEKPDITKVFDIRICERHAASFAKICERSMGPDLSVDQILAFTSLTMRAGRFEAALKFIETYKERDEVRHNEKIQQLSRLIELATKTKLEISNGLMSIIQVAKSTRVSDIELGNMFAQVGVTLSDIRDRIDLCPVVQAVTGQPVCPENLQFAKSVLISDDIIQSCFWNAKELNHSLQNSLDSKLIGFKPKPTKYHLYKAMSLHEKADRTKNVIQMMMYWRAAFYYALFIALKSREIQHDNKEMSQLWGTNGGRFAQINNKSVFKIDLDVLAEIFQQSVDYDGENINSWGQIGRILLSKGKAEQAKIALRKSNNRYSLIALGEIAELEQDKNLARSHYLQAFDLIKQTRIQDSEKANEYRRIGERLAVMGFFEDSQALYEAAENLLTGRRQLLMRAKVEYLKNRPVPN